MKLARTLFYIPEEGPNEMYTYRGNGMELIISNLNNAVVHMVL